MRVKTACVLLALAAAMLLPGGCAFRPLLSEATVAPAVISPNADGKDDVARVAYRIGRSSNVSIYFAGADGARHYFRRSERRSPGEYTVLWGGVINDPQLRGVPGGQELVQSQVLPDGSYTWVIEATDDGGRSQQFSGQIGIAGADSSLPDIRNFVVTPREFTPNQDSIHDRVSISYYLAKKAQRIQVYLVKAQQEPGGREVKYPIAEDPSSSTVERGDAGYHGYSYDGGVDNNAVPPPDGDYVIKVEAEDIIGNRVAVSSTLSIREGGKPLAEVAGGDIQWQGVMNRTVSVPLGSTMCFTATVANIGPVPIRTSGPWPGQVYKFTQNYNTLAALNNQASWSQQAGAWRFGVNFDSTGVDFPFRWAIGRPEDLEKRVIDGQTQYYLLPGHRGQVSGCIQFDDVPPISTQFWWGGLIHEHVAVTNDQIERISVVVGKP